MNAMTDTTKQRYYARRAAQERALAARSSDPAARCVHDELARRYTEMGENHQSEPA